MLSFFRRKPSRQPEPHEEFLRLHATRIEGALAVFGDRFGWSGENWHQVTGYETRPAFLKLYFREGETLEVWGPAGLWMDGGKFLIKYAEKVRWEWFYFGRPRLPENRYFREHVVKDRAVTATTNVDWHVPAFAPSLAEPAVTLQ